ncbi:ABC transporter ATP-binding protein [Sagittula sp. NFXS13]|uniref:Capsular polysaccharide transport system ATP-binding protein n=1 Tax=Sagittula marina TaxID=943940 RepID=A0A7W6DV36_9RHOB|nr:capsular polysaccharide transport system ATP-binding protein [Sagittula marina]
MIRFENLTKEYVTDGKVKTVVRDLSLTVPTGRSVGLLGRNGAGKSTLLRMVSGATKPTSGRVVTTGNVSWPVGFAGSFHPDLTGLQNCRFIARIYGVDTDELAAFVEEFANLGMSFRLPFRTYSSGMRSRLAFGISMGIQFDLYLVDEITAVGDAAFRERSDKLFKARLRNAGAMVCSHAIPQIRLLCDCGIVLDEGYGYYYEYLEDAIDHHRDVMDRLSRR